MSWVYSPLLPSSADLLAAGGGSLNVATSTDTLTLTEYPASVSFSKNVQATCDTLTLTEASATVSFSKNVAATCDTLTLTEYAASLANEKNVAANTDTLTLNEFSALVTFSKNVTASTNTLTLREFKATVLKEGGEEEEIRQAGGFSKWTVAERKLNERLRRLALQQARLEDDEEALAILLASIIRR